jgi:hypothetical protein
MGNSNFIARENPVIDEEQARGSDEIPPVERGSCSQNCLKSRPAAADK